MKIASQQHVLTWLAVTGGGPASNLKVAGLNSSTYSCLVATTAFLKMAYVVLSLIKELNK